MEKLLLITPPFTQANCPYPATAYLKGYLGRRGFCVDQADLSIELIGAIFCSGFLPEIFSRYRGSKDDNLERIYAMRQKYTDSVDTVIAYLRGEDNTLQSLICNGDFLPQASRFDAADDLDYYFGTLGASECAKFLCTLYLQDISDFIRATVTEHFEIVRYGESLALSVPTFAKLETELNKPCNPIETRMTELLEEHIRTSAPTHIGFTVPFPGNLLSVLRCAQYIRANHPEIRIILGGGYPSTELRDMTDREIFKYADYIVLDDGELPLERILSGGELLRTYTKDGFTDGTETISHEERGCPDFSGLPHRKYISLTEVTNPMHRLWSDGRWNKMMIAHGCYWAKCAFCDTSLDYICRYDAVKAPLLVDWMQEVMRQTGSRGFHFVDEAAPPKLLKEISLEILRRKLKIVWWTNIRFESGYTGDLAQLMAAAGCIAVSGGLETASDRLLTLMNKGVDIEQATIAMRNFFYAGIMVHTYLMYGFPTQTLQETVDSLEVVRQLFRAELIDSAFWHRYAMTAHSPSGKEPGRFGVARKNTETNPFANNEIPFTEHRVYNLNMAGDALNDALFNYIYGNAIERPAHKWFTGKSIPQTTVENSLITDHLIKPDASRIYDERARLVWIGVPPERGEQGLTLRNASGHKTLKFDDNITDFLLEITEKAADLSEKLTFGQIQEIYKKYSTEPFVVFYHSKKWDIMRGYGLLQI